MTFAERGWKKQMLDKAKIAEKKVSEIAISNDWERIYPNVINNRFDLIYNNDIGLIKIDEKLVPYHKNNREIVCGCYLMYLDKSEISRIAAYFFNTQIDVSSVTFTKVKKIDEIKGSSISNDFHIVLPDNPSEIDSRLSKKGRYNIKREKRITEDHFGSIEFKQYNVMKNALEANNLVSWFFAQKLVTHCRDYGMSAEEYIKKYNVSNIYTLYGGAELLAVILSCEQCPIVYIENLTYNEKYSKYSCGQVLYDWYLKQLVEKKKEQLFLSGGDLEYKKRYGSIEEFVMNIKIYRNSISGNINKIKDCYKEKIMWVYMGISPKNRLRLKHIFKI